jgi:hypothetical protein
MQNTTQHLTAPNSNFIKALIKIAHPDWTAEQVEAEAQKKLAEATNSSNSDDCEYCSS